MREASTKPAPLRRRIHFGVAWLCLFLFQGCAREPNVIVLMTDDQRADTIEYLPAVRSLADEGIVFRNSFVTSPVCTPSRVSFLTGNLASTHGVYRNGDAAARFDSTRTIATALQAAGYRTGFLGKYPDYHLRFPKVEPGWDEWLAFRISALEYLNGRAMYFDPMTSWNGEPHRTRGHSTDVLAEHAEKFIRSNAGTRFFLVVSFLAPHHPLIPAVRHAGTRAGVHPPLPPNLPEDDLSDKPEFVRGRASNGEALWRDSWGPYLELLLGVDDAVRRITDVLAELGIDRDTVVIFTSDNGFIFGEHGQRAKGLAYEPSIRVPLIVRYSRRVAPSAVDDLALNIDLAPTIAELAGIEFPADGESLLPILLGSAPHDWRREFVVEMNWPELGFTYRATRTATEKTIEWADGSTEHYDLRSDPFELGGPDP